MPIDWKLNITQRGMTFLNLTYIFVMAAKKLNFCCEKRVKIFVKNSKFFSGFFIEVPPNEGVQLKDRLF